MITIIIVILCGSMLLYFGYLIGTSTQMDKITNDHKKKMQDIAEKYDTDRRQMQEQHSKRLDKIFNDANIKLADIVAKAEAKQIKKEQKFRNFYN